MNFEQFKIDFLKEDVIEFPNQVSDTPLVSILIQTYNQAEYIDKCLEGILGQDLRFGVEILLGEDNSSDGTREICSKYAEKYPDKIRLFLHSRKNNIKIDGKPSGRFNFLYNLFSARGKYIALCEGDDYWSWPGKLQSQIDVLEQNQDCNLCFHEVYKSKGDEQVMPTYENYGSVRIFNEERLFDQSIPTLSVMFRNTFDAIPEALISIPHADLMLFSLAVSGKRFADTGIKSGVRRKLNAGLYAGLNHTSKFKRMVKSRNMIYGTARISEALRNSARNNIGKKRLKLMKELLKKGKAIQSIKLLFISSNIE